MNGHSCECQFVPPFVLENMAKQGLKGARLSIKQSRDKRDRRTLTHVPSAKFAAVSTTPTGDSEREVWDCKHGTTLQLAPVARKEGGATSADDDINRVYDFAGVVRDFYLTKLGRRSIDNTGMKLVLNVHYDNDFMNAFFDGDEMVFGDGDGEIFVSFARSLDVVAHELSHGVTQFTANLDYFSQSGALNESFSDVFGTAVTQYFNKQDAGSADWLIGDEILGPTLYGEALRSMKSPGSAYDNPLLGKDPQPDHMSNYYTGPDDNQGVHINSGIPNRAFYLAATDLGTDVATRIWYQALQNLWPTANFADAVGVITEAARVLTKNHEVPIGSVQSVRAAFKAVGL